MLSELYELIRKKQFKTHSLSNIFNQRDKLTTDKKANYTHTVNAKMLPLINFCASSDKIKTKVQSNDVILEQLDRAQNQCVKRLNTFLLIRTML